MTIQRDLQGTPKPVSHTDAAQALVEETRAMRQRIPNLVIPTPNEAGRRLTNAASVPPEFVELSAVAVKNSIPLVRGGDAEPAQTRSLMSFADAYDPLADELEALAQFIRHSTAAARYRAGSEALTPTPWPRRWPGARPLPISLRTSKTCAEPSAAHGRPSRNSPRRYPPPRPGGAVGTLARYFTAASIV